MLDDIEAQVGGSWWLGAWLAGWLGG